MSWASATLAIISGAGAAGRNTTCTALRLGSSWYGLSWAIWASSARDSTMTRHRTPSRSPMASSSAAASFAVSVSLVVKTTLPLWM